MQKRRLGRSNIVVSALGLGGLAISGAYTFLGNQIHFGEVSDEESIRAIRRAIDLGINFFDTAANYGAGHSERILGQAIADRRDEVIIATKFGCFVDEENKVIDYYNSDPNCEIDESKIRQECDASLRRLGTDYIDLYQFHLPVYPLAKIVKVCDTLEELVSEGKIRYYGWSTNDTEGARVFAQGKHCAAIQHTLNVIWDTSEMLTVCNKFDLASVNRSPLASGLLTGNYHKNSTFSENDWRSSDSFRKNWMKPILEGLDAIREILTSDGRTIAQGALAWLWARNERTIPIPGFRTVTQVEQNTEAMKFGPLRNEQMQEIENILDRELFQREIL